MRRGKPGTRARLLEEARALLDVRFRHQGRSRESGLDCAGLVLVAAWEAGVSNFDFRGYARYPDGRTLKRLFEAQTVPVDPARARPGDIALMRGLDGGAWPCHLGYLTSVEPWTLLHCYAPVRRVVESRLGAAWRAAVVGVYSWPALAGDS